MSAHLQLKLNQADLQRMAQLARRRGLEDITAYIRELMEADAQDTPPYPADERDYVAQRLRAAGLLVDDWRTLDEEIAALVAEGITPLTEPVPLPPGSRPSETLIDEDRGAY